MSKVWVAHPIHAAPVPEHFGSKPYLLRALADAGLLHPLHLDEAEMAGAHAAEDAALHDLQSWQGNKSLAQFIEQALICDDVQPWAGNSLSKRVQDWSTFQAVNVRVPGHHDDRITTADGIEDDPFGAWARAASIVLRGPLQSMAQPGEEPYVAATLARGLKYRCRADAVRLSYQAHPMRRDFLLTFDLTREGASERVVLDVIKAIRGIHRSLATAASESDTHRVQLLELELPLLGGRLWGADEAGNLGEEEWIDLVVSRIADYRERAADLRRAVARCVTDEDYLRLARDIDGAKSSFSNASVFAEWLCLRSKKISSTVSRLSPSPFRVCRRCRASGSAQGPWASNFLPPELPCSGSSTRNSFGHGSVLGVDAGRTRSPAHGPSGAVAAGGVVARQHP